ncbi:MAG TPA: hypothetical protein DEB48_10870 [Verrucomicrobiales bacterium]|nr:hypothetical protein [Verrucomicrobiales bacterium]
MEKLATLGASAAPAVNAKRTPITTQVANSRKKLVLIGREFAAISPTHKPAASTCGVTRARVGLAA